MLGILGIDIVAVVRHDCRYVQLLAQFKHSAIDGFLPWHVLMVHQLQVVAVAEDFLVPRCGLLGGSEVALVALDGAGELAG